MSRAKFHFRINDSEHDPEYGAIYLPYLDKFYGGFVEFDSAGDPMPARYSPPSGNSVFPTLEEAFSYSVSLANKTKAPVYE